MKKLGIFMMLLLTVATVNASTILINGNTYTSTSNLQGTVFWINFTTGLTGGYINTTGTVSLNTSYLDASYINQTYFPTRLNQSLLAGSNIVITQLNSTTIQINSTASGTSNGSGTVTNITAGNGLLGGTITINGTISINSPTCSGGNFLTWNGTNFTCGAPAGSGDITSVQGDSYITNGSDSGDVHLVFNETKLNATIDAREKTNTSSEMISAVNGSGINILGNAATVTNGVYTTTILGIVGNASAVNTSANLKSLGFNLTTELTNLYLGVTAQAADSAKLGGTAAASYQTTTTADGKYMAKSGADASNITSGTFADAVIASASTWNAKAGAGTSSSTVCTAGNHVANITITTSTGGVSTSVTCTADSSSGGGIGSVQSSDTYLKVVNGSLSNFSANLTTFDARYAQSAYYTNTTQDWTNDIAAFVNRSLWTSIDNYPAACSAGAYVTAIGDTLTCSTPPYMALSGADASNITTGTFANDRIASASTWNAKAATGTCTAGQFINGTNASEVLCGTPSVTVPYQTSAAGWTNTSTQIQGYQQVNITIAGQQTPLLVNANNNGYGELNVYNTNGGATSSADIVATNNIGSATSFYVDMGINGGNYSDNTWTINTANDSYLYAQNGSLAIGTSTIGKNLTFFTNGTLAANERMRINANGLVGIGTACPAYTLDVNGTANVSSTLYAYNLTLTNNSVQDSNGKQRVQFSGGNVIVTLG